MFNLYSDRYVRPDDNQSPTNVSFEFHILSIRDVDATKGKFSIFGLLKIIWHDSRLSWDPLQYGGIRFLNLRQNLVWKPTLTLSNPYSGMENLGSDDILVKYRKEGLAEWQVGDIFGVACNINVLKYPFDQHTCSINFVAGSYRSSKIRFHNIIPEEQAGLESYSENPEWELLRTIMETKKEGSFPGIQLKISIKRRYEFFLINIFCPILLLTFLSTMVFFLPVDSGERMGYSVSCLLSIMVYLTVMAETLPRTSNPVPFLAIFLLIDLFLSTLICVGAIVGLQFYHKDKNETVPKWMQCLLTSHSCKRGQSHTTKVTNMENLSPSTEHIKTKTSMKNRLFVVQKISHEQHVGKVYDENDNEHIKLKIISWKEVGNLFDKFCFIFGNLSVVSLMSIFLYFSVT